MGGCLVKAFTLRSMFANNKRPNHCRVESALVQITDELTTRYSGVGEDLEARCRGYVEFAGNDCLKKVLSLAEELQELGRRILGEREETGRLCGTITSAAAGHHQNTRILSQKNSEDA